MMDNIDVGPYLHLVLAGCIERWREHVHANLIARRVLARVDVVVSGSSVGRNAVELRTLRSFVRIDASARVASVNHHGPKKVHLMFQPDEALIASAVDRRRYRIQCT